MVTARNLGRAKLEEAGMNQIAGGVFLSLKEMVTARNLGRAKLDEEGMNQVAGGASGAEFATPSLELPKYGPKSCVLEP